MTRVKNSLTIIIIAIILFIPSMETFGGSNYLKSQNKINGITTYTPEYVTAFNVKEDMTLSPIFTPDNAMDIIVYWIEQSNSTLDIQNPYLTQFDDSVSWANDPSPIVQAIVAAHGRGVTVRVQVNEDSDSDDITSYFKGLGIDIRWMGNSGTATESSWISTTHNKLLIIDGEVTIISSINFSENALTNNREAGMVIINTAVATHCTDIFETDFDDGEIPPSSTSLLKTTNSHLKTQVDYVSHTNIPKSNFTGNYNVTIFTNPDNADDVIFKSLDSAQESIYVSMYTISRQDFTDKLIELKSNNPSMDIQVLISKTRVGSYENEDTREAVLQLINNSIPVYNSTSDDDKVDGYYHNKYWVIDGKHTFVYSGNWSPRSVTPKDTTYGSSVVNRDMGIAVFDSADMANFFKNVWDEDVAVAIPWELPIDVHISNYESANVLSGEVTINGFVTGISSSQVYYRWDASDYQALDVTGNSFSLNVNTLTLDNGIHTFDIKENSSSLLSDSITINIVNYASNENWRFLITELLPNPDNVPDDEGEYIEITNSFPFDLLIQNWQIGDDNSLYTFPLAYEIPAYSSLIIARNLVGFQNGFSKTGDIELSISLVNTGDMAQLLDNAGNYIDVVSYVIEAPDGSESLTAPNAGESILRNPLHLDTNTADDFIFGNPNPKGTVPTEPLSVPSIETSSGNPETTSKEISLATTEESPISMISVILAIITIFNFRRRRK